MNNHESLTRVFDITNRALVAGRTSGVLQDILLEVKPSIVIMDSVIRVVEEYELPVLLDNYPVDEAFLHDLPYLQYDEAPMPTVQKMNFPMRSLMFMGRNVRVAYSPVSNTVYLAEDYGSHINELVAIGMAIGLFN